MDVPSLHLPPQRRTKTLRYPSLTLNVSRRIDERIAQSRSSIRRKKHLTRKLSGVIICHVKHLLGKENRLHIISRRIRLAAKDIALSRRRSRVRIPYALPQRDKGKFTPCLFVIYHTFCYSKYR